MERIGMTGVATGYLWRSVLTAIVVAGASLAASAEDQWRTSSSLIGESKYGENFQRYDYVNPNAPKGGTLNSVAIGTFDTFNPFVVQGSAAAGFVEFGGGLNYDTLMEQSTDEPSVSHPLIADAFKFPDDYSSATYRIDPRAKWHDGKPITAEDVVWSFDTLKANSPMYNRYYANVTEAVALTDHQVEFRFDQKGNRELPKILGDMVVLPKHWWEGTDASGKKRDITKSTLEPPLGSGPYKVKSFKPGAEIVWERVKDYWGAALPVKIGRENFDQLRYTYFLDDNAAWQAFTKGGFEDIHEEYTSRRWATYYTFPAFKSGDVVRGEFKATSRANFQGFVLNTRRPQLQDRRVRQALTIAFDFETLNRTAFFGLYQRTNSFFVGGELASSGLPKGKELELLNEYKDKLPPEVFTTEYKLPVYDTPKAERPHLQQVVKLFAEAGWKISGGKMVNAKGEQFKLEILGDDPRDEITALPYIAMLKKVGIDASLRIVDASQYVSRLNNFDYDVVQLVIAQSESPGNEQRDFWSTHSADTPGSRNYAGIKDPVVDALVDKVIFARDREELVAATNALDRVLLWNFYVVPQYYKAVRWIAYWNKFGMPETQPDYLGPDTSSWWIDTSKETAFQARYKGAN
jgi:microcin C transport system substrate-binding protein